MKKNNKSRNKNHDTAYPEYQDFAFRSPAIETLPSKSRGGAQTTFPMKLFAMLSKVEETGKTHIISWQPHGRAFKVHDKDRFVANVLPQFFSYQTEFPSFLRQCNIYGFLRLTKPGPDQFAYYNELFLRGRPDLLAFLVRAKPGSSNNNSRSVRIALDPNTEPDFYSLPFIPEHICTKSENDSNSKKKDGVVVEKKKEKKHFLEFSNKRKSFKSSNLSTKYDSNTRAITAQRDGSSNVQTQPYLNAASLRQASTAAAALVTSFDNQSEKGWPSITSCTSSIRYNSSSSSGGRQQHGPVRGKTTGLDDDDDNDEITGSSEESKTSSSAHHPSSRNVDSKATTDEELLNEIFATTTSSSSGYSKKRSKRHHHHQQGSSGSSRKRGRLLLPTSNISSSDSESEVKWNCFNKHPDHDEYFTNKTREGGTISPTSMSLEEERKRQQRIQLPGTLQHQSSISSSNDGSLTSSRSTQNNNNNNTSSSSGSENSTTDNSSDMANFLEDVDFGSSSDSGICDSTSKLSASLHQYNDNSSDVSSNDS